MFERSTEQARKAVVWVQEEAGRLGHNYIGIAHLLLGFLRQDEGVAARALSSSNFTLKETREQVERIVGRGGEGTPERSPFTPRSKKVSVLTRRETLRLERNYIGTEHILLGLIDEPQGVAMRTLSRFGVDPDEVLPEVTGMIGGRRTERRSASRPEDSMYARALRDNLVRAPVEGLMIHARCVVTDEERALSQALRVDLEYTYRAAEGDKMDATVDYGAVLQDAAELLEREGFRLLETGASRVRAHVVEGFSEIWEVTVRVTKLHVPEPRAGSGVSVEARFRR